MPTSAEPPDFRPLDPGSPDEAALAAAYARGVADERTRCAGHSAALARKAFSDSIGYADAYTLDADIRSGKAAP
jgi:hypothetical protein